MAGRAGTRRQVHQHPLDGASTLRLITGVCEPGRQAETGTGYHAIHMLTPETDRTTHYFFTAVRFGVKTKGDEAEPGDPGEDRRDAAVRLRGAGRAGDRGAAADHRRSQTAVDPLILAIDVGPVRYKQVLKKLIAAEQAS